ncbi:MAG: type V CRISPR-associated protein Cas4 [Candidatus Dojkabacteria bacterium]
MDSYIQITKLNDFGFCPHSIYLHSVYESFSDKTYKDVPQTRGKIHHENIDRSEYSSLKKYLQGLAVYSNRLGIAGKIDIFDQETGTLIERKYKIKEVYEGYVLQLYAQAICLEEMGYTVRSIKLHSLSDNKKYSIPLPAKEGFKRLQHVVKMVSTYNPEDGPSDIQASKCSNCIYSQLCVYAKSP